MTSRALYSRGLIAGLSYTEMRHMLPGMILDMFAYRAKYDAALAAPRLARKLLG